MTLAAQSLLFPFADYWGFYLGFTAFVLLLLGMDLGIFNRKPHAVSMKEATAWTIVWSLMALIFCGALWWYSSGAFPEREADVLAAGFRNPQHAANTISLQFLTGYIVEWSLSVDNMFVFVVLFNYFSIPAAVQHRVLFYGILGALVFRAIFIALGALLLKYQFVVIIFGAFLIFTGIKLLTTKDKERDPETNLVLRLLRKWVPLTPRMDGNRFFIKDGAKLLGTPLFVALVMIEISDIVFAVDSVPAIFAITSEPFIVFTSNIFAILGLRSLYFLLAGAADKFYMLKYGLGIVLVFVGGKMVTPVAWYPESWEGHFPIVLSLGIIVGVIGASMVLSVMFPKKMEPVKEPIS